MPPSSLSSSYLSPLQNPAPAEQANGFAPRSALQLSPSLLPPFLPLGVRALFNPDLKIINQTIDQVLTMAWEAGGERDRPPLLTRDEIQI